MANQVAARLSGDDYQHLFSWQLALELMMPSKKVLQVTLENALAGSVDDVTVRYDDETNKPDCFYQVKYHVDQRGEYSTEVLTAAPKPGYTSLLRKFWDTWTLLRQQRPKRTVELYLVSNWPWDSRDKLRTCIDGRDNSFKDDYFSASSKSEIGILRAHWQTELEATDKDFRSFIRCLRFKVGFHCGEELEERVAERMDNLGLKSDIVALKLATGIVREWIKRGKQELSRGDIEAVLKGHDLYRPLSEERSVTVYLTTIKSQKFDIPPDYVLDWRDYFTGDELKRSHQLKDPADWNSRLLPEMEALSGRVNVETECRLVRARGLARLSVWFAFGFTFSEVARYTIEVDQVGSCWRTDAKGSSDFYLTITNLAGSPHGEIIDGEGATVAVGVSVTGSLDADVRAYVREQTEKIASLLLLRPERELGRECLRSGSDVVALADAVKNQIRAFVKHWQARRLLLFYFGPLSGACFLGHRLNAVCQEIQIMEDQQPGYTPSFLLK